MEQCRFTDKSNLLDDFDMEPLLANFDTIKQLEQQIQSAGVQSSGVVSDNYQPTDFNTDFNTDKSNQFDDCDNMEQQRNQPSALDTGMPLLANFDMTIEQHLEQQIQSTGVVYDNYQPIDFNTDKSNQFDDCDTMEQQRNQPSAFALDTGTSMPLLANFDTTIEQHLEQQIQSTGVVYDNYQPTAEIATDFQKLCIPITRVKKIVKKIMRPDKNVMLSDDALVLLAKACELFSLELTHKSWMHTEKAKRKTLQKKGITVTINRSKIYEFLLNSTSMDVDTAGPGNPSETAQVLVPVAPASVPVRPPPVRPPQVSVYVGMYTYQAFVPPPPPQVLVPVAPVAPSPVRPLPPQVPVLVLDSPVPPPPVPPLLLECILIKLLFHPLPLIYQYVLEYMILFHPSPSSISIYRIVWNACLSSSCSTPPSQVPVSTGLYGMHAYQTLVPPPPSQVPVSTGLYGMHAYQALVPSPPPQVPVGPYGYGLVPPPPPQVPVGPYAYDPVPPPPPQVHVEPYAYGPVPPPPPSWYFVPPRPPQVLVGSYAYGPVPPPPPSWDNYSAFCCHTVSSVAQPQQHSIKVMFLEMVTKYRILIVTSSNTDCYQQYSSEYMVVTDYNRKHELLKGWDTEVRLVIRFHQKLKLKLTRLHEETTIVAIFRPSIFSGQHIISFFSCRFSSLSLLQIFNRRFSSLSQPLPLAIPFQALLSGNLLISIYIFFVLRQRLKSNLSISPMLS
ncbi:hypothetical protein ZIOFF_065341 [Zingiber officinale]|uniref:Core Histone H2A/H2B/H3 domain-containing protein n=1 Tax=Zingiber officinale TaxID=94328 RepID=A0A8J5EX12_ZINOF|nr:hypothetical protein ZIOFF_065341 [Zingiber officinale]